MKKYAVIITGLAVASLIAASFTYADDGVKRQILKLFPQADTDEDGVISDTEEAAVRQQIVNRFPQADKNGDGVLSDAEVKTVLRQAARRSVQKEPNSGKSRTDTASTKPTYANVKYGENERQVFDIWLADSSTPTPLAIYIHGGGFKSGSKEKLKSDKVSELLDAGISVASINYRLLNTNPLPAAHHDARRAVQVMRSRADDWNIDKTRLAAFGGSAGAQICMWLAFSDEMAKPESSDPIERESTRLTCVASAGGQTGNSPEFWKKQIGEFLNDKPIESLANPLNGVTDPQMIAMMQWGASTLEEAKKISSRHAALNLVSDDDPPIFMSYGMKPTDQPPTNPARLRGWLIHHVNLGIALKEKMDALHLEAHLNYPDAKCAYESDVAFLVSKLLTK